MNAGAIAVRVGSATDVGGVRDLNEDSLVTGKRLFAVADGMGGHAAGEVASELAVACLEALDGRESLSAEDVRAELAVANAEIVASASRNPERAGMGTTVAGLGIVEVAGTEHWVVFNIGDCRVYRHTDGAVSRLTTDHNEVEEMLSAGTITPAEARNHPQRNVITRALGTRPAPEADLWVFPPNIGERFLICSDGLPLELDDDEIAGVLNAESDPQGAAEALVRAAVAAGGRDNVTVIVVDHLDAGTGQASGDTVPRPAS